jgi:outer membrane protein OmpA-like peptidoglycan-associated protein
MKKFKTEYIQKYLIQGNFESNFISIKTEVETKKKILAADGRYKLIDKNSNNTIELVGRHIITEAKIIKSLPKGIEDKKDAFRQDKFLNKIEVYPLKSQLKPLETKKRWNNLKTDPLIIDSFYVDRPEIIDSFYEEGTNKGVFKGTIYASIGEYIEKPIIQKSLDPVITSISNEKVIVEEPLNLDKSHLITNPEVIGQNRRGCGKYNPFNRSNYLNSGVTSPGCGHFLPAGCSNMLPGGCMTLGSGCLPSWLMGCQRIGCGLLTFLIGLAILLALLKECNNSGASSNNNESNGESRVDTVRIYEVDTVERVVLDTLYSVDTVQLSDTVFTVIKNALPLPNVIFKSNSAIIRSSSVEGIKNLGDSLATHPELNMIIAGHTDASGDDNHNDTLSFCRAKSVRDVLVDSCGISPERLMFEGYGEKCPVEDNNSIEGKTTNRRVEFRYFGESSGKCEKFKIQIDENVCNSGSYLSSVEIPNYKSDTIINHKIKAKETLYSLSKKYSVKVQDIIKLNPGVDKRFSVNRVIKIPISKSIRNDKSDKKEKISNNNWYTLNNSTKMVSVKSEINFNSRVLFRLRAGQKFEVVDSSNKKWWKIRFKTTEGYINSHKIVKLDNNNE